MNIKKYKHLWYVKNKVKLMEDVKKYHKTYFGKMMRMYLNMKQRVLGQDKKRPSYKGLPLLPREDFYTWAKSDSAYRRLFNSWKRSGYKLKYTPTVDRLDKSKGYVFPNIEFVSLSENVKRRDL